MIAGTASAASAPTDVSDTVPVTPVPVAATPVDATVAALFVDVLRLVANATGVDLDAAAAVGGPVSEDEPVDAERTTDEQLPTDLLTGAMAAPLVPLPSAPPVIAVALPSDIGASSDGTDVSGLPTDLRSVSLPAGVPSATNMPTIADVRPAAQPLPADAPVVAGVADAVAPRAGREAATADRVAPAAAPTTVDILLPLATPAEAAPSERTLKLVAGAPAQWRPALQEALGERLQLQLGRGSDHAVIRLDPPSLGRIEIVIRQDAGGGLQVQLNASNGDVLRQLHHIGDSLRQDLAQRQHGEVSVQVGDGLRDGSGRQRSSQQGQPQDEAAPHRALAEADAGHQDTAFSLDHERDR